MVTKEKLKQVVEALDGLIKDADEQRKASEKERDAFYQIGIETGLSKAEALLAEMLWGEAE